MADTSEEAARGRGAPDASTLLTIEDAAALVGVEASDVEARIESGELLYESKKRGRRDVKLIRAYDLADAYPDAFGRAHAAPDAGPESGPAPTGAARPGRETEPVTGPVTEPVTEPVTGASLEPTGGLADDMAAAVRGSGASRDAVIALAQDLEQRLDLAERERQASTASLLMAQRRILDLELQLRRRPWQRAGGVLFGLLSVVAIVVALRVPALVSAAARGEVQELGADLTTALERETGQLESRLAAEQAKAAAEWKRTADQAASELGAGWSAELADGLASSATQAAQIGTRMESGLDELSQRIEEARRATEAVMAREAAETAGAIEASARDRERFASRLADAERLANDIRSALSAERRASADDRARFDAALERLRFEASQDALRHSEELQALHGSIDELLEASASDEGDKRDDGGVADPEATAARPDGLLRSLLDWLRGG